MRPAIIALLCASMLSPQGLMRVQRRSVATGPSSISGLSSWYESDSGLTCTGGCTTGNAITAWADKSSNANNLTCAGGPTYNASQINSLPSVMFNYFNGTSCTLASAINLRTALTIFAVSQDVNVAYNGNIVTGPIGSFKYWQCKGAPNQQGADITDTAQIGVGTAACDTSWHQTNVAWTAATGPLKFRLGMAADGSIAVTSTVSADETTVGEALVSHVAAIIIYNRELNSTEITTVETYLNGKYGL